MAIRAFACLTMVLLCFAAPAAADSLYSRNLDCAPRFAGRELEICRSLERELEWIWTGHATISPSYRVTFESAKRSFCTLPVRVQDILPIYRIAVAVERRLSGKFADGQLINGSRWLLTLLGQPAIDRFPERQPDWDERAWQAAKNLRETVAHDIADTAMIWHPQNPHYILRAGCN